MIPAPDSRLLDFSKVMKECRPLEDVLLFWRQLREDWVGHHQAHDDQSVAGHPRLVLSLQRQPMLAYACDNFLVKSVHHLVHLNLVKDLSFINLVVVHDLLQADHFLKVGHVSATLREVGLET